MKGRTFKVLELYIPPQSKQKEWRIAPAPVCKARIPQVTRRRLLLNIPTISDEENVQGLTSVLFGA